MKKILLTLALLTSIVYAKDVRDVYECEDGSDEVYILLVKDNGSIILSEDGAKIKIQNKALKRANDDVYKYFINTGKKEFRCFRNF